MTSATPNTSASNEEEFRMGVMPRAELSLATSRIAKERATQANTKEFAGFEFEEAVAVLSVLKSLKTPTIVLNAKAEGTLNEIETASQGAAFDRAYIAAQLKNHEELYELADNYLTNAPVDESDDAEMQGRRLATLARATFKEHVLICTRISRELQGQTMSA